MIRLFGYWKNELVFRYDLHTGLLYTYLSTHHSPTHAKTYLQIQVVIVESVGLLLLSDVQVAEVLIKQGQNVFTTHFL